MDMQWPRWEVFEKERPDWPHRNAGSVHAPDAEMALENARDVFVRRPQCLSLWVVPADEIFSKTVEELEADHSWQSAPVVSDAPVESYFIFQKQTQRATETFVVHVGEVEAHSPEEALSLALKSFGGRDVFVWWVCPARAVAKSQIRRVCLILRKRKPIGNLSSTRLSLSCSRSNPPEQMKNDFLVVTT